MKSQIWGGIMLALATAGCPKDDAKKDPAPAASAAPADTTTATASAATGAAGPGTAAPGTAAGPANANPNANPGAVKAGTPAVPGTVPPGASAVVSNGAKQVTATGTSLVLQNDAGVGSIKQGAGGTTITGKDGKSITLPGTANIPGMPR